MSAVRDLPARPSLDSLRKQAKRLARAAAAGNGEAIARVHAQLPRCALPLSNRDAQLVVAREYGFAGWPDLTAEVQKRLGRALEWAASQARVAIHNHDHERLRTLLAEYPALVLWRDERGETLLSSTTPYALDCSDPERERLYTRPVAAEILIDAGLTVERRTWECLIHTGAAGMLHVLARKEVLPRTLSVFAALGDDEAVRARLEEPGQRDDTERLDERIVIGRALMNACRFKHAAIASRLLERSIALDPDLGDRIDRSPGRQAFVEFLIQHPASWATEGPDTTPWQAFVIRQLTSALHGNDLPAFRRWLQDEPWVLQPTFVHVQIAMIERACWSKHRESFITGLLEYGPALLRTDPPPPSRTSPRTTAAAAPAARRSPLFGFIAATTPAITPATAARQGRAGASPPSSTASATPARPAYHAGYGALNGAPRPGATGRKKATSSATAAQASAGPASRRASTKSSAPDAPCTATSAQRIASQPPAASSQACSRK